MKIINFYSLRHMKQSPDFRFAGHRHGRYEANILLKGTIELTCDGNIFLVSEGHFAIWKPGVFHMSRVVSEDGAELVSMNFDLSEDTFPKGDSAVIRMDDTDIALAGIMAESEGEALKRLTEAFFIRLSGREGAAEISNIGLSGIYHAAVDFMGDSLNRDLEVQVVAKHCGVCLTTLKKAFSDYAGKGVKAYFTDMKIHRAKELLRMGNPVSEVSDTLGFSSPAYFSQCFKREVGISPQRYRKSFS